MATKKSSLTPEEMYEERRRRVYNRLKRANGQLEAVIRAFETGENCRDVATQLAAVSKALDKASYAMIYLVLKDCISAENGEEFDHYVPKEEEVEKLFLMLA